MTGQADLHALLTERNDLKAALDRVAALERKWLRRGNDGSILPMTWQNAARELQGARALAAGYERRRDHVAEQDELRKQVRG